jgi:hypothetical protein
MFKYNKPNFKILLFVVIVLSLYIIYSAYKKNDSDMTISNQMIKDKYDSLVSILGKANYNELCCDKTLKSATWMSPLHKFNGFGKYGGADYIKIHGRPSRKYHPHPAVVFLIVGKYIYVPENLFGPLKYASETINIEQLFIPEKYSKDYQKTGTKEIALVTGSCASITISAITVQFVMDMIKQYETTKNPLELYEVFRGEYDKRIHNYLCDKGFDPIEWYDPTFFKESSSYNMGEEKCNRYKGINLIEGLDGYDGESYGSIIEGQDEKKAA